MYVDVKVGKRGEIVIPAQIRKRLKITPGEKLSITEEHGKMEIAPKNKDIASKWRGLARKANLKEEDLVYGDKLYEEVFG